MTTFWTQCAVKRNLLEFDAKVIGGEIAEILDGMALGTAWAHAEAACLDWRAGHDEGLFFDMGEAHRAGIGDVDVDGGIVGVIVDADFLVRSVVAAENANLGVVENQLVVVGIGFERVLGMSNGWGCGSDQYGQQDVGECEAAHGVRVGGWTLGCRAEK